MIFKTLYLKYTLMILLASISQITVAKNKSNVSLEEASEFIRLQSKGKVLSAKTTHFNGSKMHRIQVLTPSGRIKIFQVPVNRDPNKQSTDFIHNGNRYSQDRNKEIKRYNQNTSNRYRNTNRSSNTSRYTTPKTYNNSNNSTKGDSKQK